MTRVLLVGEGAREHALAEAICRSTDKPVLYALMRLRNPGIHRLTKQTRGGDIIADSMNPKDIVAAAQRFHVDLAVVGPEEPLFQGAADELEKAGFSCVGAKRAAAELEMSKAFMRRLMWKHRIPGRLRFKAFTSMEDAVEYMRLYPESVALKPARQVGGKGVKVIADLQAYLTQEKMHVKEVHAKAIYERHMKGYTDIDDRILIEERVEGPEYTIQAFTDGRTVKPLPAVQDNKNAFEMDIGPETGGMGSICGPGRLLPFITRDEFEKSEEIVRRCVNAMREDAGETYKGIVSGQMMLTSAWGPTIIEFYSRLGDPEAVNILPLLETDFLEICEAIVAGRLNKVKMAFREKASVVKCVAPRGYPEDRTLAAGHPATIDEAQIRKLGGRVYYASTNLSEGEVLTGGSRLAEVYAEARSIPQASRIAEACVPHVRLNDGWGLFHRKDIGSDVLLRRRVDQADLIRQVYRYRQRKRLIGKSIEWIPKKGKLVLAT
ncbi:MAG: phosphoribosylamine--glycine ligase [Candidatus Bathyarchaeia archaeon]